MTELRENSERGEVEALTPAEGHPKAPFVPQQQPAPPRETNLEPPAPGRKRGIDGVAIFAFLPAVVYGTASLLVVTLAAAVLNAFTHVPLAVWVLLWMLGAGIVFTPAGESFLARFLLKLRPPTHRESDILQRAWSRVCARAELDGNAYSLWIQDSKELNAFAAGGHITAVTRAALELPEQQLEAILAHELGHHLGGHSLPLMVNLYASAPVNLAFRALNALPIVSAATGMGATLMAAIVSTTGRRCELNADRTAAQLGYKEPLLDTLHDWLTAGHDDRLEHASIRYKLLMSHPPVSKRIRSLDSFQA